MQVKRVQDYISKEWFDETDGSYFERLNSRLQVLLKKDYPDLQGHDFISNISLLDYRLVFLDEVISNANEKTHHNLFIKCIIYIILRDILRCKTCYIT